MTNLDLQKSIYGDVNLYKTTEQIGTIEKDTVVVVQLDLIKRVTYISPAYDISEDATIEAVYNTDRARLLVVYNPE